MTKTDEEKDFQEVIRLKNALVAAKDDQEKSVIRDQLIAKIDNWFRIYRPRK